MTLQDKISAAVEARRNETIGFLQDLIRRQREGEASIQGRVAEEARALGCEVETVRYSPSDVPMVAEFAAKGAINTEERESVVVTRRGKGGGRSVIFFAHPDGEPIQNLETWARDPFAAVIEQGRLYGWGVADDLAGVATGIQALAAVRAAGLVPAGDVIMASTPSKRHARGVSALMHGGMTADAAVYLHPAESGVGMREIKAFASGQLNFRLTIDGQPPATSEPSHVAFAHRAVNPIDKAWVLYRALKDLDEARAKRIRHPAIDAAVGRSTNILLGFIRAGFEPRYQNVDRECVMGGSVSFPPPETLEQVQAEIEAAIKAAAAADPWLAEHPPKLEWESGVTGAEVKTEAPLYQVVAQAISAVTGEQPFVNPMHTASDIRNPIVQKGIPTVGLGPLCGDLSQNRRHDEWVDVEDYLRAVKVTAGIIAAWCGT